MKKISMAYLLITAFALFILAIALAPLAEACSGVDTVMSNCPSGEQTFKEGDVWQEYACDRDDKACLGDEFYLVTCKNINNAKICKRSK